MSWRTRIVQVVSVALLGSAVGSGGSAQEPRSAAQGSRTTAQQRRTAAQDSRGLQAGGTLGAAAVDVRRRNTSMDIGPMFGARLRWTGVRSGISVAADVQAYEAEGGTSDDIFRAVYLMPAWEVQAGTARVGVGIGVGMFRFDRAALAGRTEYTTVGGASAALRLPASFALELMWRRTGLVRGFRANVWSLQLLRLWQL